MGLALLGSLIVVSSMSNKRLCGPLFTSAVLLLACGRGMSEMNDESKAEVALIEEFETVFSSKLIPFSFPSTKLTKQDANALHIPFAELAAGLDAVGHATGEILQNSEIVLVGARDFRPPPGPPQSSGLGGVRSDFCYVIVPKYKRESDFSRYFRDLPVLSAGQVPVWKWSARLSGESPLLTSFYAGQIGRSYLLVSNNVEALQNVSKRLSLADTGPARVNHVYHWLLVKKHAFWGYRRYRYNKGVNEAAAGLTVVPRSSEELMFFVNSNEKDSTLRLFLSAADQQLPKTIGELPHFKSLEPRIWETIVPLGGDQKTREQLLNLMGMFGFGLYL
jgi:hypothetical protein